LAEAASTAVTCSFAAACFFSAGATGGSPTIVGVDGVDSVELGSGACVGVVLCGVVLSGVVGVVTSGVVGVVTSGVVGVVSVGVVGVVSCGAQ
jgi:hypothetical protein